MIHIGLEKLEYKVRFLKSCYYPFSFSDERRDTKILFGACFGIWLYNNSIRIAFRPSENRLDMIDLFRVVYSDGFEEIKHIGNVEIEKDYTIKVIFEHYNNVYRIQVASEDKFLPQLNICKNFKYPSIPLGYTIKKNHGDKIFLERQ